MALALRLVRNEIIIIIKLQLDDDITDLLLAFKDDPNLLSNI